MAIVVSFVLVAVGSVLLFLGAHKSIADWNRRHAGHITMERNASGDAHAALAKVLEALEEYPLGRYLIVCGLLALFIAGLFGGAGQLGAI